MLKTTLVNPNDGSRAHVSQARAVLVEQRPVPPFGVPLDADIFREFLRQPDANTDMTVLASPAAPAVFSVVASDVLDIYIKSLLFTITGLDMVLGDFGDIPALVDPCILAYDTGVRRVVLDDAITTNFALVRLGGELMPGVGADSTSALKVGSPGMGMDTEDSYNAFIDFARVFGFPWGVRLAAGTEQRFDFVIQSDLTAIDIFVCNVFGFVRAADTVRP